VYKVLTSTKTTLAEAGADLERQLNGLEESAREREHISVHSHSVATFEDGSNQANVIVVVHFGHPSR
jgi:hypothetical protein